MNSTAVLVRCLLLVLLQTIINNAIAGPTPKASPCLSGKDTECNTTDTDQLEPENCTGDDCTDDDSDLESSGMRKPRSSYS